MIWKGKTPSHVKRGGSLDLHWTNKSLEVLVPSARHWKTWFHQQVIGKLGCTSTRTWRGSGGTRWYQHRGLHYLAMLGGELCFSCASLAMKRLQCHSRLALSEGMSSRCCSTRGGKATVDIPDISSDTHWSCHAWCHCKSFQWEVFEYGSWIEFEPWNPSDTAAFARLETLQGMLCCWCWSCWCEKKSFE